MSKRPMSSRQKSQAFFQTVEAGDIALFEPFKQSIAMFGYTKVGKTSSCHILVNSPLKAELQDGNLIYRTVSHKYSTAVIGNSTESETEIPNIFQGKFRDPNGGGFKTVTVLDQPGYGDSYGFHRIFSNGYFHYRTFSKTPKLKFILAIKKENLNSSGDYFKNTITNFIQSFTNYEKIKKSILKATVFLITQVDPKTSIDQVRSSIERLKQSCNDMIEREQYIYQEIIDNMLLNNKIFLIEKPQQVNNQTRESDLLRQIYEKTTFWERPLYNNTVDMDEINFSVAEEIIESITAFKGNGRALFKQDFDYFVEYMNKRIKLILIQHNFSLYNLIETLKKDAISSIQSHNFLSGMAEFVRDLYHFNKFYDQRREKTQANLFSSSDPNEQQKKVGFINNEAAMYERMEHQKEMKAVYFIKKFRVLEHIKTTAASASLNMVQISRQISELQSISFFFIDIFKKFNILRMQRSDSQKIIYKYSYIVQRLIEEAKIITLILFSKEENKRRFDEIKLAMIDIFRPLKDQILEEQFQQFDIVSLKTQFLTNLDFNTLQVVNREIITFLESVPDAQGKFVYQISNQILRYAQIAQEKRKNMSQNQKRYIITKLFKFRGRFYENMAHADVRQTKKCTEFVFKLTNALGRLLLNLGHFSQAREAYKSINNASIVLQIFENQLKAKSNQSLNKLRQLYIDYGNFASFCHRKELAITNYQEAYARSESYQQIEEVSNLILKLETEAPNKKDPYLSRFNEKKFCDSLEGLSATIDMMITQ